MAPKFNRSRVGEMYKEALSRLRIGIETSGAGFIMHDFGIIVPIISFGVYVARIGEENEPPWDGLFKALIDRGALYFDDDRRWLFGDRAARDCFIVICHDALGIWPDEELPSEMHDGRGFALAQISVKNVSHF
jgi:hypothetical protein